MGFDVLASVFDGPPHLPGFKAVEVIVTEGLTRGCYQRKLIPLTHAPEPSIADMTARLRHMEDEARGHVCVRMPTRAWEYW